MKHIICMVISGLMGVVLLAGTCSASLCDPKETVVFFGNGIKTEKKRCLRLKKYN